MSNLSSSKANEILISDMTQSTSLTEHLLAAHVKEKLQEMAPGTDVDCLEVLLFADRVTIIVKLRKGDEVRNKTMQWLSSDLVASDRVLTQLVIDELTGIIAELHCTP
jgi:hypothetical protein